MTRIVVASPNLTQSLLLYPGLRPAMLEQHRQSYSNNIGTNNKYKQPRYKLLFIYHKNSYHGQIMDKKLILYIITKNSQMLWAIVSEINLSRVDDPTIALFSSNSPTKKGGVERSLPRVEALSEGIARRPGA
jgi:hypothetical protein